MKKRTVFLFIAFCIICQLSGSLSALAEESPNHAPNMYVNWNSSGNYNAMTVDWYCEKDAENTYWAVHNWDDGYAGFQNKDGKHVLLLSLWDRNDGKTPTIEYVKSGESGDFGNEGTGKHVFTNYDWKIGKWYTMLIQTWDENGKSYIGQWVSEENGEWTKTAVISYQLSSYTFTMDSMFQEDFTFNNLLRKCRLKNAFGRTNDSTWISWNSYVITNTYYPTIPHTSDNVNSNINYDCNWGTGKDNEYVWVQSGGGDFTSNGKDTPPITYIIKQSTGPKLLAPKTNVSESTVNNEKVKEYDSVNWNGHTYTFFEANDNYSWDEAKKFCEEKGGYLATITSKDEDNAVFSWLKTIGNGTASAYLGATNLSGKWKWITGENFEYTNWHEGEPSKYNAYILENYLDYYGGFSKNAWNDTDRYGSYGFICEKGPLDQTTAEVSAQQPSINKNTVNVTINSINIQFDQNPIIQNGRTLVPLRVIFETLGAKVKWDQQSQTITATKGDTTIKITIGSDKLYKNGKVTWLDVAAQVVNDRTLVPVRAVSESFGCNVEWDDESNTVIITN